MGLFGTDEKIKKVYEELEKKLINRVYDKVGKKLIAQQEQNQLKINEKLTSKLKTWDKMLEEHITNIVKEQIKKVK